MQISVERHIHLCAGIVRHLDRTGHVGKREILRTLAQTELIARKIHRIGAEIERIAQLLEPTSGSQQLGLLCLRGITGQ